MASALQQLRKEAGFKSAKDFVDLLTGRQGMLPMFEDELEPAPDDFSISLSTYTRYEKDPSNMPLSTAKVLADQLGCSIDVIAGRDHIDVDEMRGDVQKRFDALPDESQQSIIDFIEFVETKAEREAKRKEAEENRQYERMASFYERMFYAAADSTPDLADKLISGTDRDASLAFFEYVWEKLKEKRDKELTEAIVDLDMDVRAEGHIRVFNDNGTVCTPDVGEEGFEEGLALLIEQRRVQMLAEMERRDKEVIEKIMNAYARLHGQTNICYHLVDIGSSDQIPQLEMDHITPLSVTWSDLYSK